MHLHDYTSALHRAYLFPEAVNQVYFLPNPNAVVSVIDPMMVEFSTTKKQVVRNQKYISLCYLSMTVFPFGLNDFS